MLHNKFAVVKLWPKLKTAEDEVIARLKASAASVGLECLEVDSFARLIEHPHTQLTQDDVDFVISLHYETPKRYDIFSFVALWNPLHFYYLWGYRKFAEHLVTHDDFLSCASESADNQVSRLIAKDPMRVGPSLKLYHSLSTPLFPPTIGDQKLCYVGMNWERGSNKPSRHGPLLEMLDRSGGLRIYGPKIFLGVDVWAGFESYIGPIAFDGASVVRAINKAGISLVLSSEAHKDAELMSSRLFESLAAGAVIICDENPWARRFFGDTLLYVDTTKPVEETHAQIQGHLAWVERKPSAALNLIRRAQERFNSTYRQDLCLQNIYREFPARKATLEALYKPTRPEKVTVVLLMPGFRDDVLRQHIASCLAQKNVELQAVLLVNRRDAELFGARIQAQLDALPVSFQLEQIEYFQSANANGSRRRWRRLGSILHEFLARPQRGDLICFVFPNERLFSDHLASLVRAHQDCEGSGGAASDILRSHHAGEDDFADLSTTFQLSDLKNPMRTSGRFLFRVSSLPPDLQTVLPYLHKLAITFLAGTVQLARSKRCTVVSAIQDPFYEQFLINEPFLNGEPDEEWEILVDYDPIVFARNSIELLQVQKKCEDQGRLLQELQASIAANHDHAQPISLGLDRMSLPDQAKLTVALAHSIPLPSIINKMLFGIYRLWRRLFQR